MMTRRLQRWEWIGVGLATVLVAVEARASESFSTTFANCTEFVGEVGVPESAARALVPDRYQLIANGETATLVIRIADCKSVQVGNVPARPGRVAHVGILIVSPDGTAIDPNTSINNYTLTYATNVLELFVRLVAANVPAALDPA